jgi:hypothetical protein
MSGTSDFNYTRRWSEAAATAKTARMTAIEIAEASARRDQHPTNLDFTLVLQWLWASHRVILAVVRAKGREKRSIFKHE